MNRFAAAFVTATVLGFSAGAAHASSVSMNSYKTNHALPANVADTGISVDVTDTGAAYNFIFTNSSSIHSAITKVYFDKSLKAVLGGGPTIGNGAGVNFRKGTVTKKPMKHKNLGWSGSLAFLRTFKDKINNGILNGGVESLTVSFAKVNGTSLQDVRDLLIGSNGGIAAHLVDLEGRGLRVNVGLTTLGGTIAGEEEPPVVAVPTPAASAAGLALMSFLAARRRRA